MEATNITPTPVNKKLIKKQFKLVYPKYDAEKTKEVSLEDAAKIIVECMTNAGQTYTPEQAVKILSRFDVDKNGRNAKNEVKKSLMIAAKLEELNEKMIQKMKKKWEKKQNKKKKKSKEDKKKDKLLKKQVKKTLKAMIQVKNFEKKGLINLNDAETFVIEFMQKMNKECDSSQVKEVLAKLDSTNSGGVTRKELKITCKQFIGKRDIDFEKAFAQRAKWQVKKEKQAMKKVKKEEKQKAKLLAQKEANKPAPSE